MRVLVVHNRYQQRGGEDVVVDREVALLRERGHEVFLALRDNDSINSTLSRLITGFQSTYSFSARRQLSELLRQHQPDVCHIHNFFPQWTPSVYDACREAGVPVVQTLHNYRIFCSNGLFLRHGSPCELCKDGSTFNAVKYACYRNSRLATLPVANMIAWHRSVGTWSKKVDRFIALTEFARRKFIEGGLPPEKISVRYNFSPEIGGEAKPQDYGIYVGRLSEEKGIRTLIKAWRPAFPRLLVVGDGPLLSSLQNEARADVEFLGRKTNEEALALIASARFLILPTECYEGAFPLVLCEAMMRGVPVLATRIGGIPELISHDENGILFSPQSEVACVEAVQHFLALGAKETSLGLAGRELFRKHFAPDVAYRNLQGLYQSVIENRHKK